MSYIMFTVQLVQNADETFSLFNLKCKAWTYSGEDPDPKVSKDGVSIGVGGFKWFPKLDVFEVKIPKLHFGKKIRGRLKWEFQSSSVLVD